MPGPSISHRDLSASAAHAWIVLQLHVEPHESIRPGDGAHVK